MLDSLVRVSRRVVKNHFANVRNPLEPYTASSPSLPQPSQQAAKAERKVMNNGACLHKGSTDCDSTVKTIVGHEGYKLHKPKSMSTFPQAVYNDPN